MHIFMYVAGYMLGDNSYICELQDLDKAFQSKLATASNNRARKVDEVNTETETYIRQMMEQGEYNT